jgi:hypothetical protein
MKTDLNQTVPVFPQTAAFALAQTRQKLQQTYEQTYPALREIIHLVLDEEEARASELLPFPHLFLPDLVEEHLEKLNLQATSTPHDVLVQHDSGQIGRDQRTLALCA